MKECFLCSRAYFKDQMQEIHICNRCYVLKLIQYLREGLEDARNMNEIKNFITKELINLETKLKKEAE